MLTVSQIIDQITTTVLVADLNVRPTAISNAKVAGEFPARWYRVVLSHCEKMDIDVHSEQFRGLFSFVDKHGKHSSAAQ
jgi:hypothetical protein